MIESVASNDIIRWTLSVVRKRLPERLIMAGWPHKKLLSKLEVFAFDQAPRFYVRPERGYAELSLIGFNVFNFTPFNLAIVGADLRLSVNSCEWFTYATRFPQAVIVPPYQRSGFHFNQAVSDAQAARLRDGADDWVTVRVSGAAIVRFRSHELRKEICADLTTIVDRP
jgi:hypothetical protein